MTRFFSSLLMLLLCALLPACKLSEMEMLTVIGNPKDALFALYAESAGPDGFSMSTPSTV